MTVRSLLMAAVAAAVAVGGGGAARAEPIPTTTSAPGGTYQGFTYRTEVIPTAVTDPVGPATGGVVIPAGVTSGGGSLSATFTPVADYLPGTLNTPLAAGQLTLGGAASSESRATVFGAGFGAGTSSGAYTYDIWVRDAEAKSTVLFAFRGLLAGGVAMNADGTMTDTLTNTLVGPSSLSYAIGSHTYTVELLPVPAPRLSSFKLDGAEMVAGGPVSLEYQAIVSIDGVPQTVQTPEPATAVLAVLGLGGVGALRRLRRKSGAGEVAPAA